MGAGGNERRSVQRPEKREKVEAVFVEEMFVECLNLTVVFSSVGKVPVSP